MASKAQAQRVLARYGISIDRIEDERLEGYFSSIDAPAGSYLNCNGLHEAAVQGYNMAHFWDSVIADASEGISSRADGGCEAQACNSD